MEADEARIALVRRFHTDSFRDIYAGEALGGIRSARSKRCLAEFAKMPDRIYGAKALLLLLRAAKNCPL